jgi:hypothetical protein
VGDVIKRGPIVGPEPEADDGEPLDWRDLAAIGQEQARLYALWRQGRLSDASAGTGMLLLSRLLDTCERAANSRPGETTASTAPPPERASRFLT